jgi:hypothetical protein
VAHDKKLHAMGKVEDLSPDVDAVVALRDSLRKKR